MLNQLLLLLKEQINNDLLGFRIIPGSHKRTIEHYTVSPQNQTPYCCMSFASLFGDAE